MNKIIEHFRKYCMWYILAIAVILTLNFLFLPLYGVWLYDELILFPERPYPRTYLIKPPPIRSLPYYFSDITYPDNIACLAYLFIAYFTPFLYLAVFLLSFKHKKISAIALLSILTLSLILIIISAGLYTMHPRTNEWFDGSFPYLAAFYVFLTIFLLVIAYCVLLLLHYIILPRYISKKSLYLRIAKLEQQVKELATTTDEVEKDD